VVTTKKAKPGKPQFEVKAVTGVRVADHGHVRMMDSKTLYNYHREYFRDPVLFEIDDRKFKEARPASLLDVNTNWLKELSNLPCFRIISFLHQVNSINCHTTLVQAIR